MSNQSNKINNTSEEKTIKKKKKGSARSIETFYRNAYRTQLDLTTLADNKANIMISINGLIVTAIIATGGFAAFSDVVPNLLPISILFVSILSMIFAMLAASPQVANLHVSKDTLMKGEANLLYFNNFLAITEAEYGDAMINVIEDTENIYRMMSTHIYNLGKVLIRKYKLLRISYIVFLFGMVINAMLFALYGLS